MLPKSSECGRPGRSNVKTTSNEGVYPSPSEWFPLFFHWENRPPSEAERGRPGRSNAKIPANAGLYRLPGDWFSQFPSWATLREWSF